MRQTRTRSMTLRSVAASVAAALALGALSGCVPLEEDPIGGSGQQAGSGDAAEAEKLLGELTVADARPMRGYSRERFKHWRSAGKNCDVRDTVLERDGTGVELDGCNVVGGSWSSVYDNRTIDDPSGVDIDHTVPLANAWRSGADEWEDDRRSEFANDLTRPQLLAVSASSNRSKGDQDPSQWKPTNQDAWCDYAIDWITVKSHWELTVTAAEKTALQDMLETCV
ncbi:HNH endonuclease family protein [Polymorphospora rubra]|uniref:HNH endonuclease family protein n=1 Tax=Polymorphospora rubra TaxID=338584 RepID=UPI001BB37EA8|nr:HNH endonuclease family protein [Polymorphospora rubra]